MSDVVWYGSIWLVKQVLPAAFYGSCICRCSIRIEVCHRNQPNKTKLYCIAIIFTSESFKTVVWYISNDTECLSYS